MLPRFGTNEKSIDHLRPEGRIKKDNGDWSSACQLEPDKTAFWLKLPSAPSTAGPAAPTEDCKKKGVVIAVEIKPKGATMPVGTLVPPGNNRLKYRVARFDAQQRFKAQVTPCCGRRLVLLRDLTPTQSQQCQLMGDESVVDSKLLLALNRLSYVSYPTPKRQAASPLGGRVQSWNGGYLTRRLNSRSSPTPHARLGVF